MNYSLLALQNPKLQPGFTWLRKYIKLLPYKPHGVSKEINKMPIFTEKVNFCLLNDRKVYAVIPRYPTYAISEDGESVLNLKTYTFNNITLNKAFGYMRVSMQDYTIKHWVRTRSPLVHKLVAMAWCHNDNFVTNNLVDHKDKDKLNNHKDNLRWVSNSVNQGITVTTIIDNYVAVELINGIRVAKSSLNELLLAIGLSRGVVTPKTLPTYNTHIKDMLWYITTKGDTNIPSIEHANPKNGIIVRNKSTGKPEFYNSVAAFLNKYGKSLKWIDANDVNTLVYSNTEKVQLKLLGVFIQKGPIKVNGYNVITEKLISNKLLSEAASLTNIDLNSIKSGLRRNGGCYSLGDWLFSYTIRCDCIYTKTIRVFFELHYSDNKIIKATSLREVARLTKRDRHTIKKYIKSQKPMTISGEIKVIIKKKRM